MTIRRTPEDFHVEEQTTPGIVLEAPQDKHFAVYRLRKATLTTPEATARLAGALGIPARRVSYAGLKDKHAVTVQLVSVDDPGDAPTTIESKSISATRVGWAAAPANASWIAGNRFTIVVRDLTDRDVREMGRRASLLRQDGSLLFVNYFGEQRFAASKNKDMLAGRLLVRGDAEGALRLLIGTPARKDSGRRRDLTRVLAEHWGSWKKAVKSLPAMPERAAVEALDKGASFADALGELPELDRVMAVESYQSYLWNQIAAATVSSCPNPITVSSDFGQLLYPPAKAIRDELRTLQFPTPAAGMSFREPWARAARAVLSEEHLPHDGPKLSRELKGKCPDFGAADRPLFAAATAFEMSKPEPDDLGRPGRLKRTLRFDLPRGSYATVLLRALGE